MAINPPLLTSSAPPLSGGQWDSILRQLPPYKWRQRDGIDYVGFPLTKWSERRYADFTTIPYKGGRASVPYLFYHHHNIYIF